MQLFTTLFFLSWKISVKVYQYQVQEEVRYLEIEGGKQVEIVLGEEVIYPSSSRIDLNNYYPIDAFQISGDFREIRFYHDQDLVATLFPKKKDIYQAEDMVLEDATYDFYTLQEQVERIGFRLVKMKEEEVPLLNLSSFVESLVRFPKRC